MVLYGFEIMVYKCKFWVGINLHLENRCLLIKFDRFENAIR
jgi:hypothetical protein